MKRTIFILSLIVISCSRQKEGETFVPSSWIEERVENAEAKMTKDEAGRMVWESIQAHGGLEKWFANGPIKFHFDYQPLNGGTRRNTYNTVDQWSSRAVQELASDRDVQFGWDGKKAWIYPDTVELPVNARFWATTPYYFVGLPFVLAAEGAIYEKLDSDTLNGQAYELVKVTYESGTGDAPDDFYIIYIHPETHLMGALRYIVSYPGFFPDGGHSPEKIMVIKDLEEVKGIHLPTGYQTHMWQQDSVGEYVTNIEVTGVAFDPDLKEATFEMPKGARVQEAF